MFNMVISSGGIPKYLSSDIDPLFLHHKWNANLRILGADKIKKIPFTPLSHPFVERLIGTVRRKFLDQTLFLDDSDLEKKLEHFRQFYNFHCTHTAHGGNTPSETPSETTKHSADLNNFHWKSHWRGLYQLPVAT